MRGQGALLSLELSSPHNHLQRKEVRWRVPCRGEGGRKLTYAGKVQNGFSDQQVKQLQERAKGLQTRKQPMQANRTSFPKATWLKPVLLGDVEYRAWTASGLLRHPSFKGLRQHRADQRGSR